MSLLTDAATEAVYPLLPVFITQVLGGPPVALGIIEGAADATSSALKVFAGRWSDRVGARKPMVVAGYALSSLVRPFLGLATSWGLVFAIRVTDRVGKGLRGAPRDAMLAALAPPGQRGRVFGYHRSMDHAGAAIGPLLATVFLLFSPDNYRLLFGLTIIPGALAVMTLLRVPETASAGGGNPSGLPDNRGDKPSGLSDSRGDKPLGLSPLPTPLKRYLWILAVFTLGNSSDAFLLLQLSQAGVPLVGLTALWSAQHAIKAMLSMRGGALSDRLGRRTLIIAGWILYAIVYAGFGWSQSVEALIGWFMLYSVYAAAVEGSEKALIADLAPEAMRASAYGWHAAVQGFGALAAGLFFGLLWQTFGAPVAFTAGAALAVIAATALWLSALAPEAP
ncbi:MAG: MFS transporter [Acidobacteriota bacterium]|nr:MFS transporter [Acidobacteriota bacterium]